MLSLGGGWPGPVTRPQMVKELCAGMDGPYMRDVDVELLREFHDRPSHAVQLKPLPRLEVLEHRGLVLAHFKAGVEAAFQRDGDCCAERAGDGGAFFHDGTEQGDHFR